ncbi:hypothetical protein LCGC14_0622080 [marine sediment metagenome]|uniref:Uncharacterized protein n=1 Tax=marine sediment metagenome TaxID=412755 RepID=A0A0F9TQX6_9ZZZZ
MARVERFTSQEQIPVQQAQLIDPRSFPADTSSAEALKVGANLANVFAELAIRRRNAQDSLAATKASHSRTLAELEMQQFMVDNPDPDKWEEGLAKISAKYSANYALLKMSEKTRTKQDIEQQAHNDEMAMRVRLAATNQDIKNDITEAKINLDGLIANDDGSKGDADKIDKALKALEASLLRETTPEIAAEQMEEALRAAKKGYWINQSKLRPDEIIKQMEKKKKALVGDDFGLRPDGTRKGKGFLGVLKLKGGGVATEYSVGVRLEANDGKETDIPSLVPTLTKKEIEIMVNDIIPNKKPVPKAILQKAVDHANKRVNQGKSPFLEARAGGEDKDGLGAKDFDDIIASAYTAKALSNKALDIQQEADRDDLGQALHDGTITYNMINNTSLDEKEQESFRIKMNAEAERKAKGIVIETNETVKGTLESMAYDISTGAVTIPEFRTRLTEERYTNKTIDDDVYDELFSLAERKFESYQAGAMKGRETFALTQLVTFPSELGFAEQLRQLTSQFEKEEAQTLRQLQFDNLDQYKRALRRLLEKPENKDANADWIYTEGRKLLTHYRKTPEQLRNPLTAGQAAVGAIKKIAAQAEIREFIVSPFSLSQEGQMATDAKTGKKMIRRKDKDGKLKWFPFTGK